MPKRNPVVVVTASKASLGRCVVERVQLVRISRCAKVIPLLRREMGIPSSQVALRASVMIPRKLVLRDPRGIVSKSSHLMRKMIRRQCRALKLDQVQSNLTLS